MMTDLRYGWYGDDFTGATDTLAVMAHAGLRTMLFLGVPSQEELLAAGPLDAVAPSPYVAKGISRGTPSR